MANLAALNLRTKDVMQGMTLTVRMPRSFTIRTKFACWLLGLAGRVMDVPCEVEMRREGDIKPGDVVQLNGGGPSMTVLAVHEDEIIEVIWFAQEEMGSVRLDSTALPAACVTATLDDAQA